MTKGAKSLVEGLATRLSLEPTQHLLPTDGGIREFLAFEVGNEHYALPLSSIHEIMKLPPVTPVPRGPRQVLGIISVRGRVTTVIDMRRRLDQSKSSVGLRSRVLLVDNGEELMGVLVDRVLQVYRLHADQVELASVMGGDISDYVVGIGRPGRHGRGRQTARGRAGIDARKVEADRKNKEQKTAPEAAGKNEAPLAEHDAEILILLDPVELLRL